MPPLLRTSERAISERGVHSEGEGGREKAPDSGGRWADEGLNYFRNEERRGAVQQPSRAHLTHSLSYLTGKELIEGAKERRVVQDDRAGLGDGGQQWPDWTEKKGVSERKSEVKASQAVQAAGGPTGRIQEVRLSLVQSLSDQDTRKYESPRRTEVPRPIRSGTRVPGYRTGRDRALLLVHTCTKYIAYYFCTWYVSRQPTSSLEWNKSRVSPSLGLVT